MPHDREERHAWYTVLECAVIREAWRAAYENRRGPADTIGVLLAVLAPDDRPRVSTDTTIHFSRHPSHGATVLA
jgi:hypothetical protein